MSIQIFDLVNANLCTAEREMTTPLFLLRCVQLGIHISELDLLTIGMVNDMYAESGNDSFQWPVLGDQAAMDAF